MKFRDPDSVIFFASRLYIDTIFAHHGFETDMLPKEGFGDRDEFCLFSNVEICCNVTVPILIVCSLRRMIWRSAQRTVCRLI